MKKNPYPGKFIVIEGLDGSGQTTQVELLRNFFLKKGYKVLLTKEPTKNSETGKKIRKIINTTSGKKRKDFHARLQELFAKDRLVHLKSKILPALKKGKVVISDRYFFTSFAYGVAKGVRFKWLVKINDKFLLPDLTFILKTSPQVCVSRIKKRAKKRTFFEERKHFAKASKTFQTLPKKFKNVYMINGEKPIKEVFAQVKALLQFQVYP